MPARSEVGLAAPHAGRRFAISTVAEVTALGSTVPTRVTLPASDSWRRRQLQMILAGARRSYYQTNVHLLLNSRCLGGKNYLFASSFLERWHCDGLTVESDGATGVGRAATDLPHGEDAVRRQTYAHRKDDHKRGNPSPKSQLMKRYLKWLGTTCLVAVGGRCRSRSREREISRRYSEEYRQEIADIWCRETAYRRPVLFGDSIEQNPAVRHRLALPHLADMSLEQLRPLTRSRARRVRKCNHISHQ
jgi:hypothetical protein